MNGDQSFRLEPTGVPGKALVLGVVCLAVCLIELVRQPTQFFRSYLFGEVFWLGIGLGCLGLLMLQHLVAGKWGIVLRRPLEAAARTLAWMGIFFIPVLFGMHRLFVWTHPGVVAADHILQLKAAYLNTPFFIVRAIGYFVLWIILIALLTRWSSAQDATGEPDLVRRMRNLSGPGLAIFGFTVSFAGFDWVMSLEPHFFSTIYGMMFVVTEAVGAMSFITLVAIYLADRKPLSEVIQASQIHDFGNLLLVFTLLWAYLGFDQFLIIWSGNLQNEIPWYVYRIRHGWAIIALGLVIFHFAAPLLLLFQRVITFQKRYLKYVAGLLFIMSIVDLFWLMMPSYEKVGPQFHWSDWVALIGLGGLFVGIFFRQLRARPLLPLHDPHLVGVLQHE